jgi:transcriptional regulator with XRE-family HTH domain
MKLARTKAGVEQEEMAEYLGVSTSTTSKWENGRNSVKVAFLRGWADKTGYNMSSLIPPARRRWVPRTGRAALASG